MALQISAWIHEDHPDVSMSMLLQPKVVKRGEGYFIEHGYELRFLDSSMAPRKMLIFDVSGAPIEEAMARGACVFVASFDAFPDILQEMLNVSPRLSAKHQAFLIGSASAQASAPSGPHGI